MGFILNAILSLVTALFGRIPWKYFVFILPPFFVLGALMSVYFGMNWFSSYAFVLVYSSAIGVVFLFLYGVVGGAVEKSVGVVSRKADIEVSEETVRAITRVSFYVVVFLILLVVAHFAIGLPRAAAYFLASLVGKEPVRSFDLGYYFVIWVDYIKAVGIFASYVFFFLFVNSIGYLFLNEDVKAGEYEETKPVSEKKKKLSKVVYVIAFIICIYAIPAATAFLFEAVFVPDRTTAYGSLALDDESERIVWADLSRDGVPDPVFIGGNSGSPDVYAAALDGASGELLWHSILDGEWCDADIRSDGELIFALTRNPDDSFDEITIRIADGSETKRRRIISATRNRSSYRPYLNLHETDEGLYYVQRDNTRVLALSLDELNHQISNYYSLRLYDSEFFDTYYTLIHSNEKANLIVANYKYKYGLIGSRNCDALYYFDGAGNFQWEFADGELRSIEGALGINGPLVLIYGRDRNGLPILAGVNARDGELLWIWNRYDQIEPPLWERIKRRIEMVFG